MQNSSNPSKTAYFNLGFHHRPISTSSAESQLWFDRGLIWAYSFNHGEAERCFTRAAECDARNAMAWWGIAYAAGPNYNKAWRFFDQTDLKASITRANRALVRASELRALASPIEQALIRAITKRFPQSDSIPDDLSPLDRAYADAMRLVYQDFGSDPDIAALFADALMCITPRGLWDLDTGKPTGSHTIEARKTIESGLEQADGGKHPALCHLYIHLEMSPFPELALTAADRLRYLVPDASHMLHTPTHIDAAIGDYRRAITSNQEAIDADDKYFALVSASLQYVTYRMHYICGKLYAAMMSGRFTDAMSAAEKLETTIDDKMLSTTSPPLADAIESFLGSKAHVLVRFGRWEEILCLSLPEDRSLRCAITAIIFYARSLAFSALGRIEEAEHAQREFEEARVAVPTSRLNSIPCREVDILEVSSAMLSGELEYRKGNIDLAFHTLREAIRFEDGLPYTDPPAWMQPVRHALGGLLLEQDRVDEAELLFREDLGFVQDFPRRRAKLNNVWGLHGLQECVMRSGKLQEALFIRAPLDIAVATADITVKASCFCRVSVVGKKGCCP